MLPNNSIVSKKITYERLKSVPLGLSNPLIDNILIVHTFRFSG